MGLQQFEHRLERLVEGTFAKAFRGELQPIELGRRLTREMDLQRAVSVRGLIAPNLFHVVLSKDDFERFGGFVEVLARELVDAAKEHARSERYAFAGPVQVDIGWNPDMKKSTFAVSSEVAESDDWAAGWLVLGDGRRIAVRDEPLTIGRLPECAVPISDPNASRHHAEVLSDANGILIRDLGSTNGTRVNGARIDQHRLMNGDVIRIGTTDIAFEAG